MLHWEYMIRNPAALYPRGNPHGCPETFMGDLRGDSTVTGMYIGMYICTWEPLATRRRLC